MVSGLGKYCLQPIFFVCVRQKNSQAYALAYTLSSSLNRSLNLVVLFGNFFKCRHCKIAWAFWDQIQQDKNGFHLSLHVAVGNAEEEKYYETFYTLKLTLGPIDIAKNVNRADFKISILYIDFYGLLRFAREIESILLKYLNLMRRSEKQGVRSTTYYDFFDKSIYFLYSATFRVKTSAHLQAVR